MFAKIYRHALEGTLVKVAKTKLRLVAGRGPGNSFYGDQAADYDTKREGQQYWDDQQRIAEELLAEFPDSISVLDVPFGTGRFVEAYNRKRMQVSGLEISEDMVQAARDRRGDAMEGYDVRVGDARALPWPDNSFDLVMSYRFLSSIISIADQEVVLRELARVTKDAAIMDIAIRDASAAPLKRQPRPSERSGVQLTEEQVRAMLAKAGFKVERIVPQYSWMDEGHRCAIICRVSR